MVVGSTEQKFGIDKALLCSKSGYFEKECKDDTSIITLPHQDISTFRYFLYWLYNQRLLGYHNNGFSPESLLEISVARAFADMVWEGEDTVGNLKNARRVREEEGKALIRCYPLEQLVGLYILAEELQIHGLKNKIIAAIAAIYPKNRNSSINASTAYWSFDWGITDKAGPVAAVNLAYEKLPGTFVLKCMLVLIYVNMVRTDCKEVRNLFNSEFLCDVLAEFRGLNHGVKAGLRMIDLCRWDEDTLRMSPAWGQEVYEGMKIISVEEALQNAPLENRQWFFLSRSGSRSEVAYWYQA